MPSRKLSLTCLWDKRPSCQLPNWQDAVIRQLEIIGEATKRLSPDLRRRYPQIPWKRIAGLRDVLIHDYLGVDIALVWRITQTYLPELKHQVEAILTA